MAVIPDGAGTLIDALDSAMSGEPLALAAERSESRGRRSLRRPSTPLADTTIKPGEFDHDHPLTRRSRERRDPGHDSESPDDLLLIREVAAEYHVGKAIIRQLVTDGQLQHLRVGVTVLIPRWVVLEWIRNSVSTHPAPLKQPGQPQQGT
jgi:excisionase family DNA binding protein